MKRDGLIFIVLLVLLVSQVSADWFDVINFSLSPFNTSVTIAGFNRFPDLGFIPDRLYACQADNFFYVINATDLDVSDNLAFNLVPETTFFEGAFFEDDSQGFSYAEMVIAAGILQKNEVEDNHSLMIEVTDGFPGHINSTYINITIMETNDAPVMQDILDQNVVLVGSPVIVIDLDVFDTEDGNRTDGNLSFNTTFISGAHLFNFSENGSVSFAPGSADQGSYVVEVCAIDSGLYPGNIHPSVVAECGADSILNKSDCKIFNMEISEEVVIVNSGGSGGGGSSVRACNDRKDNDGDGAIDYPDDPGCISLNDNSEIDDCKPTWVCVDWSECTRIQGLLEGGDIAGEEYRNLTDQCSTFGFENDICGTQDRSCRDLNACNKTIDLPALDQFCQYSENPSCSDGLKNCHSDGCEFLVDCGGPCEVCPSCADGIQNGGEEGVDCGGTCPGQCTVELPSLGLTIFSVVGIIVVMGLVVVVVLKYMAVSRMGDVVAPA